MDWIEALTGWDPDGGDGSFEAAIVIALLAFAVFALFATKHRWDARRIRR